MSVVAPFPYTFKDDYPSNTAVFKLWFGSRYFIYKGLHFKATVERLSSQIHWERSREKENSILSKVTAYINKARVTNMTVEVIFASDAIAQILMVEYESLQKAKKDPNCLNTSFVNTEHYPKWVPQVAINEFTKLLGTGLSDKQKNLRRFLSKYTKNSDDLQKIMEYISERFR